MSAQQGCEWLRLYRRIKTVLKRYGQESYWTADGGFHVADYHILDDNWGNLSHKVEIHNLQMLQPPSSNHSSASFVTIPSGIFSFRWTSSGRKSPGRPWV